MIEALQQVLLALFAILGIVFCIFTIAFTVVSGFSVIVDTISEKIREMRTKKE